MNMGTNRKVFLCLLIILLQLFAFKTVRSDDNDEIPYELNRVRALEEYAALKWQKKINVSYLALGDVDQDGINDIVTGDFNRREDVSYIYVWDGINGSVKWKYISQRNRQCRGILVEDINDNGTPEIIIYGVYYWSGWIRGFEYNGTGYTEKWVIDSNNVNGSLDPIYDIAVGDVDSDGAKELILATGHGEYSDQEGYIYIFDAINHTLEWKSPSLEEVHLEGMGTDPCGFGLIAAKIEIADVDNDGVCEIIAATSGCGVSLYVFDGISHEPEWIYPLYMAGDFYGDRCMGMTISGGILISVVDVYPQRGYIYLLNGSTHDLERRSDNLYHTGHLVVDDLDNDTKNEIIVGTVSNITNGSGNEKIYIFDATNFEILWEYDLDVFYGEYPYLTPVVATGNVDDDSRKEVIIGGKEHLYVFGVRTRKPDLKPDRISHSPNNVTENELVYINTTVRNLGRLDAMEIPVEFAVDNKTINRTTVNFLHVNTSQFISFQWVAVAGEHKLEIMVDRDNNINESDEDNNVFVLNINVNAIPTPLFTVYPQIVHTLEKVNFNASNSTDNGPIQYYFDFGDGNTTSWINNSIVNHNYSDDGVYETKLKVRDLFIESDWITQAITVLNRPPTVSPTANEIIVYTYVPIEFKANANDFDGTMTYSWDFGDENISTSPNPVHSYSDNGVYTVHLKIEDDDGSKVYSKMLITVLNRPPIVNVTANNLAVYENEIIQFSSNSYDMDGEVLNYSWNFGDDSFSYAINPMHAYPNAGVYYVNLSIMDDDNSTNYTTLAIIVYYTDIDDDGILDYMDSDIDGDGWKNTIETQVGTDPRNKLSVPRDSDGDGIPDSLDPDRDGDNISNEDDLFPDDPDRGKLKISRNTAVWWWSIGIIFFFSMMAILFTIIRRRK